MAGGRQIRVELIGDEKSLRSSFQNIGKEAGGLGSKLGSLAKGAAIAGGAGGIGLLTLGLKAAIDTSIEHQKSLAQTNAALKSTGGQAGVTAKDVTGLADSIEKMSGMDDLAVQKGENMLLTFTNIRNEAGKGNDIFSQSTRILADMSTAMGTDTAKQAIQLGKALNDPIKGVSALARVGVTFTQGQKDSIKAMVDSGNTMGAQKLILAELGKEFGGSAKAAGETFAGKLAIAKARLDDVFQAVGDRLLPVLTSLLNWLVKEAPTIEKYVRQAFGVIRDVVQEVAPYVKGFVTVVRDLIRGDWSKAWADFKTAFVKAVSGLGDLANKLRDAILGAFGNLADKLLKAAGFGNLGSTFKSIFKDLAQIFRGLTDVFVGLITGDWGKAWKGLSTIVGGAIALVGDLLKGLAQLVWDLIDKAASAAARGALALGKGIVSAIKTGLGDLGQLITQYVVDPVTKTVSGYATTVASVASKVGTAISNAIGSGIKTAASAVTDAVVGLGTAIGNLASRAWDAVVALGKGLAGRIALGIVTGGASEIVPKVIELGTLIGGLASRSWDAVVALGKSLATKIGAGLREGAQAAVDAAIDIGGKIGNLIGRGWDAVVALGRSLAGKIGAGIRAGVGAVTDAVIEFGTAIGNLAGRAWGQLVGLGRALVGKIASGISDAGGAVSGAISGIFGSLAGWVKDILGIGSPSRVFMEIGHDIVRGLVKGLWNKAGDLKSAAVALAKKILLSWPWAKIKALFGSLANVPAEVKALFPSDIWDAIFGIPSKQVAPGAGPGGVGGGGVPAARGGLFTSPTLALIGENGPEAVVPLSPTAGGPDFVRGHGALTGGGGVTVIVQTPAIIGTGLERAAAELERYVTDIQRRRYSNNTGRRAGF